MIEYPSMDAYQKKVEELKLSHDEWKNLAIYLSKVIDRFRPGWTEKHLINGEPEYELVFTPAPPKRPPPCS